MLANPGDTDSVYFAALVEYLCAYPEASLGSVLSSLTRGSSEPLPHGRLMPSPAAEGSAGQRVGEEATLVAAWQAALDSHAPLSDLVSRTKHFLTAAAAQPDNSVTVKRLLTPLLTAVVRGESLPEVRAAYGLLLPLALVAVLREATEAAVLAGGEGSDGSSEKRAVMYTWLWRQMTSEGSAAAAGSGATQRRSTTVRELLMPYAAVAIEPLEKELRFHFHPGSDTANVHEPQHFFDFLRGLLLERQPMAHAEATGGSANASDCVLSLVVLAQTALCTTAAATLRETYQWSPTSPLLTSSVFAVHTLNAYFDFTGACEARVSREALLVLTRSVAFPRAVDIFMEAAAATTAEAFASAPAVLWRRSLLRKTEGQAAGECALREMPGAGAFLTRSGHLVRCVEALVRRLSGTLLQADPHAWRAVVWGRLVASALALFLDAAQHALSVQGEDDDAWAGWLRLCVRFELLESAHLVATAAEDWLGLLFGEATAERGTAEALDEVLLLRDRMARAAAEAARQQMSSVAASGGVALTCSLWGLETFLRFMDGGPTAGAVATASSSSKFILETVLRQCVVEGFTPEQRVAVRAYAQHFGLLHSSELFLS